MPLKTDKVFAAIAAVQHEMPSVGRDLQGDAGSHKYKYASWAMIWKDLSPLLKKNGLSLITPPYPCVSDNRLGVYARVTHSSGQFIACRMEMLVVTGKKPIWAQGSALTYGKRYAAGALLGLVVDDDDDGKGATGSDSKPKGPKAGDTASDPIEELF